MPCLLAGRTDARESFKGQSLTPFWQPVASGRDGHMGLKAQLHTHAIEAMKYSSTGWSNFNYCIYQGALKDKSTTVDKTLISIIADACHQIN